MHDSSGGHAWEIIHQAVPKPKGRVVLEWESGKNAKACLLSKEAAEQMSISRATVYELMRRGKLAYVMIGRHRIIRAAEIERFLAENEVRTVG